jgi:rare lipoprotein A (peptidoglycan hydrolase)
MRTRKRADSVAPQRPRTVSRGRYCPRTKSPLWPGVPVVVGALLAVVLSGRAGAVSRPPRQPPLLTFLPPLQRPTGQLGIASWYGPGFHGHPTASGELYNQDALTAAHPTLPLGTPVEVLNLANGKSVRVRITDRGPYVRGRTIDLSRRAAQKLGMVQAGLSRVRIKPLGAPRRHRRSFPGRPPRLLALRTRGVRSPQPQAPSLQRVVARQRRENEGTVF